MAEPAAHIAVLARAPVAGAAKTRLIPALGAAGAARLHRRLLLQTLATAGEARLGRLTLWCAPDARHRCFRALAERRGIDCRVQPAGDLGRRMFGAFATHADGRTSTPLLLIGTDCPALSAAHLRDAASTLANGADAALLPAEDGGYVLIGLRAPQPALFDGIDWGSAAVLEQTRTRLRSSGLRWSEGPTLWDVDRPTDLARLAAFERAALPAQT